MTSVVSITLDDTTLNLTETAIVTIVFSEDIDPATLDISDFSVGGGSLSNLTTTDNITWTATFLPDADTQSAANVITLADNSFSNLAGGSSTGGSSANYAVNTGVFDLASLNGTNGFALNGIDGGGDRSGTSVSSAGDVNGDGFDDIIIGANSADPNGNSNAGESYIVFGQAGGFDANLDLSTLNGSNGFILNGIDSSDLSGSSVSSAGDVNGDSYDDIIIGARNADPNSNSNAGESYVVFGQASGFAASLDLSTLNGSNGFVLNGINAGDFSGSSVSSAGDINGDGYDDIIIGASDGDPNSNSNAGESYVVFGQANGFAANLDLSTLNGSNGFVLNGINIADRSGGSVASAGDINSDGYDDIIIGAIYGDLNSNNNINLRTGESYVVFGQADGFAARFDLSTLNGSNGFVLSGINNGDRNGWSVSSAGDVNGDGHDDIIIGASDSDPNGNLSAGESYVVFGQAGGFAARLNLSSLDGSNGFALNGINSGDLSGTAVSNAGDFNGDGYDDLIIGAIFGEPNGNAYAGESYIVFGQAGGFAASLDLSALNGRNGFVLNGIKSGDTSGTSISRAGDVNGDGYDDIIIGAPGGDPNGNISAGESYVIFGSSDFGPQQTTPTLVPGITLAYMTALRDSLEDFIAFLLTSLNESPISPITTLGLDTIVLENSFFLFEDLNIGEFITDIELINQLFEIMDSMDGDFDRLEEYVESVNPTAYAEFLAHEDVLQDRINEVYENAAPSLLDFLTAEFSVLWAGVTGVAGALADALVTAAGPFADIFSNAESAILSLTPSTFSSHPIVDLINLEGADYIQTLVENLFEIGKQTKDLFTADTAEAKAVIIADISALTAELILEADDLSELFGQPGVGSGIETLLGVIETVRALSNSNDELRKIDAALNVEGLTQQSYEFLEDAFLVQHLNMFGIVKDIYSLAEDFLDFAPGFSAITGYLISSVDVITNVLAQHQTTQWKVKAEEFSDLQELLHIIGDYQVLIQGLLNTADTANGYSWGTDQFSTNPEFSPTLLPEFENIFYGTDTADLLSGTAQNDSFILIPDSDIVDGGLGNDHIILNIAAYGDFIGSSFFQSAEESYFLNSDDGGKFIRISSIEHFTIFGGGGNDFFQGGNGNDAFYGAFGNDLLFGLGGDDYLDGGDGNDELEGHSGEDTLIGGSGNDTLLGGEQNDILNGGEGDDILDGGAGSDHIIGGGGNDTYVTSLTSYFTIESADRFGNYVTLTDLRGDQGIDVLENIATLIIDGESRWILSLHGTYLSDNVDEYIAGNQDDYINALVGDDIIFGRLGDDDISGDEGDDTLHGDEGFDYLDGGLGNDFLHGGSDDDLLEGGEGTDTAVFSGIRENYTIIDESDGYYIVTDNVGTDGTDELEGIEFLEFTDVTIDLSMLGGGDINLTNSNDTYTATAADEVINALDGNDLVNAGGGDDTVNGGDGNDNLRGDAGDDYLDGGFGADILRGGTGADVLNGGAGTDVADYTTSGGAIGVTVNLTTNINTGGDAQGDTLFFIDRVNGSTRADNITGNANVNYLRGFAQDDTLIGGAGNDYLQGDAGADVLDGGAGTNDWAYYFSSPTGLTVNLGNTALNTGEAIGDSYIGIENVLGSQLNDNLSGDASNNFVRGVQGDDMLYGLGGNDFLRGDQGADLHDGGAGVDWAYYATSSAAVTINLGTGAASGGDATGDTFISIERVYGSVFNDDITGDSGANYLRGSSGADTLTGGGGNDFLQGDSGADVLDGGAGADWAYYASATTGVTVNLGNAALNTAEATGDSYISIENVVGGRFDDDITGDGNNNTLRGFLGDDTLNGGGGDDILRGESGADTFVFEVGGDNDTIIDWSDADDFLDLTDFGYANVTAAMADAAQVGSDVVFTIGSDTITIEDTTLADITDNLIV